jgi:hypothetical protein
MFFHLYNCVRNLYFIIIYKFKKFSYIEIDKS